MPRKTDPYSLLRRARAKFSSYEEYLEAAKSITDEPRRTGKRDGKSDESKILQALQEIAQSKCGLGESWSQSRWVEEVHARLPESYGHQVTGGKATIKKYLKKFLSTGLVVLNHVPVSIVRKKSNEEQFIHWYACAIAKAIAGSSRPGENTTHITFEEVNAAHKVLCAQNMPAPKPTEHERLQWIKNKWKRTSSVPAESRKKQTLTHLAPPSATG